MKATWIQPDGRVVTLEVAEGQTLMAAAVARSVPGIIGECGGSMSCATCHVVVDAVWFGRTGGAAGIEDEMLDVADAARAATSRLSCQIRMRADLDGIVLRVPAV